MPRLRVLSGREVCKIWSSQGFEQVRRKGSHIIMQKKEEDTTITVPVPDHPRVALAALGARGPLIPGESPMGLAWQVAAHGFQSTPSVDSIQV
jgi:predicted RNA binding protein YcfA (HicA-like mRNA interferase family)